MHFLNFGYTQSKIYERLILGAKLDYSVAFCVEVIKYYILFTAYKHAKS